MNQSRTRYEWNTIPWKKIQRTVFKLQKRIYRAQKAGDSCTVRKLQRLLVKSMSAKLLAVRKVTQENRGKNTPGTDGIKSLTPRQRLSLAKQLTPSASGKPTRRVWIPKAKTEEKRPLGIPTMWDRASQALIKLALEPEWEAKFEPHSYGFRLGRCTMDAITAIRNSIKQLDKYVLDADITKCVRHDGQYGIPDSVGRD